MTKLLVQILHTTTGEVATYPWTTSLTFPEDLDLLDYMWTEGSYGCDCNLGAFFFKARPDLVDKGFAPYGCETTQFEVSAIITPSREVVWKND